MTLYSHREKFEKVSIMVGRIFAKLRLTPNQWTFLSLLPAVIAAYFLFLESFLYAAIFFAVASFIDLIDGSVARVTGRVTKFGAYLDTVVDRYIEGLILFGLLFATLPAFYIPHHVWIFIVLFGGMMTTYVKAAAKEKNLIQDKELKGGLLQRTERLIILFIGLLLATFDPLYLTYILVILAVLTNLSACQRFFIAWRAYRNV